jgi:DMSO reductase anchor subunit
MGDAAQVPTQWSVGAAAVALCGLRRQMESRRRNEILAWVVMAVLGLSLIGSRLHLIAVSWRSGR